jgi:hypothetical protein
MADEELRRALKAAQERGERTPDPEGQSAAQRLHDALVRASLNRPTKTKEK